MTDFQFRYLMEKVLKAAGKFNFFKKKNVKMESNMKNHKYQFVKDELQLLTGMNLRKDYDPETALHMVIEICKLKAPEHERTWCSVMGSDLADYVPLPYANEFAEYIEKMTGMEAKYDGPYYIIRWK